MQIKVTVELLLERVTHIVDTVETLGLDKGQWYKLNDQTRKYIMRSYWDSQEYPKYSWEEE